MYAASAVRSSRGCSAACRARRIRGARQGGLLRRRGGARSCERRYRVILAHRAAVSWRLSTSRRDRSYRAAVPDADLACGVVHDREHDDDRAGDGTGQAVGPLSRPAPLPAPSCRPAPHPPRRPGPDGRDRRGTAAGGRHRYSWSRVNVGLLTSSGSMSNPRASPRTKAVLPAPSAPDSSSTSPARSRRQASPSARALGLLLRACDGTRARRSGRRRPTPAASCSSAGPT